MTPVRAAVVTGPAPKTSSDEGGEVGDDLRSCFLVAEAAPLRSGQDLICSTVLAGVPLLLSRRDYEPVLRASDGSRIKAVPPQMLPILLPSRWTTLVPSGRLWNVGPACRP